MRFSASGHQAAAQAASGRYPASGLAGPDGQCGVLCPGCHGRAMDRHGRDLADRGPGSRHRAAAGPQHPWRASAAPHAGADGADSGRHRARQRPCADHRARRQPGALSAGRADGRAGHALLEPLRAGQHPLPGTKPLQRHGVVHALGSGRRADQRLALGAAVADIA